MSKEKQRLKRAKKKKRIYAKDKTPVIRVPEKPENTMQLASYFLNLENIWTMYVDKVIFGGMRVDLPPEEDLSIITNHMSITLRKQVLFRLMGHEGYNPFTDKIPLEVFPENMRRSIEKIQKNLEKQRDAIKKYSIRDIPIRRRGKEVKIACLRRPKENINEYLFAIGYDIVILHDKGEYIIISNPKAKKRILFDKVYKTLDRSEEDTWYLHGHKGLLKTERHKFSKLPLMQVIQYIKKL